MAAAIKRAHHLSGQLIELVRPNPPTRELIDVGALVESLRDVIKTMAPIGVTISIETESILIMSDPMELERVLFTFVANSIEASIPKVISR